MDESTTTEQQRREIERLRARVAELESENASLSQRIQEEGQSFEELVSIFEGIDASVYIADPETCEILYVNGAVKELLGDLECVAVKEGIGQAARMMHPSKAQQLIRNSARKALTDLGRFKPFKLSAPITMEIRYKDETDAARYAWFPRAERTGERSLLFTHEDYLEVLRFYMFVR